jgi:hypothetical protein
MFLAVNFWSARGLLWLMVTRAATLVYSFVGKLQLHLNLFTRSGIGESAIRLPCLRHSKIARSRRCGLPSNTSKFSSPPRVSESHEAWKVRGEAVLVDSRKFEPHTSHCWNFCGVDAKAWLAQNSSDFAKFNRTFEIFSFRTKLFWFGTTEHVGHTA